MNTSCTQGCDGNLGGMLTTWFQACLLPVNIKITDLLDFPLLSHSSRWTRAKKTYLLRWIGKWRGNGTAFRWRLIFSLMRSSTQDIMEAYNRTKKLDGVPLWQSKTGSSLQNSYSPILWLWQNNDIPFPNYFCHFVVALVWGPKVSNTALF